MGDRYWVSSTTSNWGTTASWAITSNGTPGASIPVNGDNVFFDGAGGNNGNCNLTYSLTGSNAPENITINGYTGAFSTNANNDITLTDLVIASGTFNAASGVDINARNITFSGTANIALSSSNCIVSGNWSSITSGTLTSSTASTITLNGTNKTVNSKSSYTLGSITVNGTYTANTSIRMGGNLFIYGELLMESNSIISLVTASSQLGIDTDGRLGGNGSIYLESGVGINTQNGTLDIGTLKVKGGHLAGTSSKFIAGTYAPKIIFEIISSSNLLLLEAGEYIFENDVTFVSDLGSIPVGFVFPNWAYSSPGPYINLTFKKNVYSTALQGVVFPYEGGFGTITISPTEDVVFQLRPGNPTSASFGTDPKLENIVINGSIYSVTFENAVECRSLTINSGTVIFEEGIDVSDSYGAGNPADSGDTNCYIVNAIVEVFNDINVTNDLKLQNNSSLNLNSNSINTDNLFIEKETQLSGLTGCSINVSGNLDIRGDHAGRRYELSANSTWNLNFSGLVSDIRYVSVQYCVAALPINAISSFDRGNNENWEFVPLIVAKIVPKNPDAIEGINLTINVEGENEQSTVEFYGRLIGSSFELIGEVSSSNIPDFTGTFVWEDLIQGATYEWYAQLGAESSIARKFTTLTAPKNTDGALCVKSNGQIALIKSKYFLPDCSSKSPLCSGKSGLVPGITVCRQQL